MKIKKLENKIESFVLDRKDKFLDAFRTGKDYVVFDFAELIKFDPDLDAVLRRPEQVIEIIEKKGSPGKGGVLSYPRVKNKGRKTIKVRIKNLPSDVEKRVRNIDVKDENHLISVRGVVKYISNTIPTTYEALYVCKNCGHEVSVKQSREKLLKKPGRCKECGKKDWKLINENKINTQGLVIEEPPGAVETEQPRDIPILLKRDLVLPNLEKGITAGSKVRVDGIVKFVRKKMEGKGWKTKHFSKKLVPVWVEPLETTYSGIKISDEDIDKIKKEVKSDNLFEKLRKSIVPSIAGYPMIKEAIALQVFGGVSKEVKDGNDFRGDIHILLVGDPGVGKSSFCRYVKKLAPKSASASGGSGTTRTGLTASAVREETSGEWGLEAGAMVLANKGVAVIDELDKMGDRERNSLHEAMANQEVTINKADIHTTLPAKASVLASANPEEGRFSLYNPKAEQINLNPALVSRFDLAFPIMLKPDKKKDTKVADKILDITSKPSKGRAPFSTEFLRKYITYAKKIRPKVTEEVHEKMRDYYVEIRTQASGGDEDVQPIPITPRQLEAMIRLSEASARARLSKKVSVQDFKRAKMVIEKYRKDMGIKHMVGDTEVYDMSSVEVGTESEKIAKKKRMKRIIRNLEKSSEDNLVLESDILDNALEYMDRGSAEELLRKLKSSGFCYEPRHNMVKILK